MTSRRIRVSSRALGESRRVIVHVYDSVSEMRQAARSFNGLDTPDAVGVTQAYCTSDGLVTVPVIRLARDHLGTQIVSHEVHHAAAAIYGSTLGGEPARDVLLYRHGYYGGAK